MSETTIDTEQPPALLLGPLLRRGGAGNVAVWVEASQPCSVRVDCSFDERAEAPHKSSHEDRTFCVGGRHYAIVDLDLGQPARAFEYEVALGETPVWPDPELGCPPSRYEPWTPGDELRLSGGSCRQQAPQDVRRGIRRFRSGSPITDELGADALAALANEVQRGVRPAPHLLLLTGDQVYADERHPTMTENLQERRGGPPPEGWPEVTSFEEYAWLYQHTWSHPLVRWLLSSVPSIMVFDDHDVIDDWNISDTWQRDIAQEPWWQDRLDAALMSYWVYQHLGNLTAAERAQDALFQQVRELDDGEQVLRDFAHEAGTGTRRFEYSWSYRVPLGPITIVVLDSRNGRVLDPDDRSMLSPGDWRFLTDSLDAHPNALIISSVPWLLPPGVHTLERLISQAVAGRWGRRIGRVGERIRREIDLEHWAAFGRSVERMADRLAGAVDDPSAIYPPIVFSGDVHFAYIASKSVGNSTAYQVVSSPMRQGDAQYEQVARRTAMTARFDRTLRRIAGRKRRRAPRAKHSMLDGIWTENNIASFTYLADAVDVVIEHAELREDGLTLSPLTRRTLARPS